MLELCARVVRIELRVTRFDLFADSLSLDEIAATVTLSATIFRAAFVRGAIGLFVGVDFESTPVCIMF